MDNNMYLVMIDECGDESYVDSYKLQLDLDEDELDIWKDRKITAASERYPEASGFYFEDRRDWNRRIYAMMREA